MPSQVRAAVSSAAASFCTSYDRDVHAGCPGVIRVQLDIRFQKDPINFNCAVQELDVGGLVDIQCTLAQQELVLEGCVARRLLISLPVAEVLVPKLGPLELLEQLSFTDEYCFGCAWSAAVQALAGKCPKLGRVVWGPGESPLSSVQQQSLKAALPTGVELVVREPVHVPPHEWDF